VFSAWKVGSAMPKHCIMLYFIAFVITMCVDWSLCNVHLPKKIRTSSAITATSGHGKS
jgi:hypothetical protein